VKNINDNKEIWKWILDQKDSIGLVNFAKKINLKIPRFRNIDLTIPKVLLINETLKKVMKVSNKNDFDFPEMDEVEILDKGMIYKKIELNQEQLIPILESLLLSNDVKKFMIAHEVYRECVKNKSGVNGKTAFEYDTSLLLKRIEVLENENEMYQNIGKMKEDEYLKQTKALEKKTEKIKANLQRKDNELIKLNKNIICLNKALEEKNSMINKILELEISVKQKDLQISALKSNVEERDLNIIDLMRKKGNKEYQATTRDETTDGNSSNKNVEIGLWITEGSIDLNKANLEQILITNLDTEDNISNKLKNIVELWYIDYEISVFMVRRLQKILRKSNSVIKLNKFISMQEIEVMLSKRS